MAKILILYSSTDGHTGKICLRLQEIAEEKGNQVTLLSVQQASAIALESFDKIVVGASIRYGKHGKAIYEFIRQNEPSLSSRSNAFFSVNLVARKPGKNTPQTNPYVKKFLRAIAWKPDHVAVFAGKVDYQKYSFPDRFMIRLIMLMTNGPTDPKACVEYTDWSHVDRFGRTICAM